MRRAVGNYELDDDPARIDPAAAAAFLTTEAYWGRWRTEQEHVVDPDRVVHHR